MIDLDFLSTSSSDSAGLSGAGTAHISDFAMNEIKEKEDKILSISSTGSWLVIHALALPFQRRRFTDVGLTDSDK